MMTNKIRCKILDFHTILKTMISFFFFFRFRKSHDDIFLTQQRWRQQLIPFWTTCFSCSIASPSVCIVWVFFCWVTRSNRIVLIKCPSFWIWVLQRFLWVYSTLRTTSWLVTAWKRISTSTCTPFNALVSSSQTSWYLQCWRLIGSSRFTLTSGIPSSSPRKLYNVV